MIRRVDCLGCEFDEVLLDEAVTEAVDEHLDECRSGVRVDRVEAVVVDCLGCGFDATESGRDAALDSLSTHESDTGHELELRRRETLGDDVEPGEALTDGGHSFEESQAAAAVRNADDVPPAVLVATPIGACSECGSRFPFRDEGIGQLDPCPECGSDDWQKVAYRLPSGREVEADASHIPDHVDLGGESR